MNWKLNYPNIPVLAIGFSRGSSCIANVIQFFRKTLKDPSAPDHTFIVTENHGQLFATEQTAHGLRENSLERYAQGKTRIVAMYVWKGFDDPTVRDAVQRHLALIRRRAEEDSLYDFWGLLSFVPGLKHIVKPHPYREWCSETIASLLQNFGYSLITKTTIAPDELLTIIKNHKKECTAVLGYYI